MPRQASHLARPKINLVVGEPLARRLGAACGPYTLVADVARLPTGGNIPNQARSQPPEGGTPARAGGEALADRWGWGFVSEGLVARRLKAEHQRSPVGDVARLPTAQRGGVPGTTVVSVRLSPLELTQKSSPHKKSIVGDGRFPAYDTSQDLKLKRWGKFVMAWLRWFNPLLWLRWMSHFAWCWVVTLPWSRIGGAVPAILALVGLVFAISLTYLSDPQWRRGLVENQLRQAKQVGAKEEISLLSRRLLRESPGDLRFQFEASVAMVDDEAGEQALANIERLATKEKFGPAATWLLEQKYSPVTWGEWDEAKRQSFGTLLQIASDAQPENKAVASYYADYLLLTGNREKALSEITKLVSVQPARALQGAAILRQAGKTEQAANMAKSGLDLLTQRGNEEPENVDLALARAQFLIFLQQYEDAINVLSRTAKVADDPRVRSGIAEVFVLWSRDQMELTNPTARFARQLELLSQGVKVAPNHPMVISDLMSVILQCSSEQDPMVVQLRDVLVQGVAPEPAHFIRGTTAMMRNDVETATLHLELAVKAMPMMPAVLNNLAVALATREAPDLERAMQLVDTALQQLPDQPYFHETKAQIQLQTKDYRGAVTSFEKALSAMELRPQVHDGLRQAYEGLGQKDLADSHAQQAERYRKKQETKAGT